jgi:hypothetical protein
MNKTRMRMCTHQVSRGARLMRFWAMAAPGAAIAFFLLACQQQHEKKPEIITTGILDLGPASDFRAGTASTRFLEHYGIMVTNDSGTPLVLRPICARDGAMVNWDDRHNEFVCPQDGSTFDLLGRPLKGPCKVPLRALPAERTPEGTLRIDLAKLNSL